MPAVFHPNDYSVAHAWARDVRASGRQAIRYPSVRDRPDGICWTIFGAAAFRSSPTLLATWLIRVTREVVPCRTSEAPFEHYAFPSGQLDGPC